VTAPSLRKDGPPFGRVLIANRGEIAVRIIRACRELGMVAVAVYSDADADALHVRLADEAVGIGPAAPTESYLRIDGIVEAARASRADAVHPGYGFLAERAAFARAVASAGMTFVGPSADAIDALGDKLRARRTAAAAGVPVVPGTLEPAVVGTADAVDAAARMVDAARDVGLPLLVKAAAGGGGRGMRRVERLEELPALLAAASSEAASAFGDGAVYLEREIRPSRHIEVQLLGDDSGTVVALGERDCSIQRRHQKLVEEAPAPGLSADERGSLHELAVRVGRAAGLTNAATAEFLFDAERRFWFLEVNTRLQVEHGVTELVTGVDLVAEQFRLAAGRPLSERAAASASAALAPARHSIEVRLTAEDPGRDFAPTPGRIGRWSMPSGPGVRVDSGVESGTVVRPEYDNLVAKLLVVAADRSAAVERLRRALDEVAIDGIQTTLPLHRRVARDPSFRAEDLSTDWLVRHWDGAAERGTTRHAAAIIAGLAALDRVRPALPDGRPGGDESAWRALARREAVERGPG
jgi:acetyl-CoA/propionyl-CoA carboxylase, biotin carboxylase, biotin carboxyl carrier protein